MGAHGGDLRLRDAIGEIYAAPIPAVEKRKLACRVVADVLLVQRGAAIARSFDHESEIDRLEEALHEVAQAAGHVGKMTIQLAKTWLRDHGDSGTKLASRIAKLSKSRNVAAHPDVSLVRDIRCLSEQWAQAEQAPVVQVEGHEGDEAVATKAEAFAPEQTKSLVTIGTQVGQAGVVVVRSDAACQTVPVHGRSTCSQTTWCGSIARSIGTVTSRPRAHSKAVQANAAGGATAHTNGHQSAAAATGGDQRASGPVADAIAAAVLSTTVPQRVGEGVQTGADAMSNAIGAPIEIVLAAAPWKERECDRLNGRLSRLIAEKAHAVRAQACCRQELASSTADLARLDSRTAELERLHPELKELALRDVSERRQPDAKKCKDGSLYATRKPRRSRKKTTG
jgi:hypothetical protein